VNLTELQVDPAAAGTRSVHVVRHFDLVIIGSGSGNTILSPAFEHWDVALVEHGTFGGTCLNVGCIPTKMYVYAADVAETIRRAARYGIDASIDKVRWSDIRDRVFGRIDPIAEGGRRYRAERSPNVTVYPGSARFTGPRQIATGTGETITADRVVIAAGSRPVIPAEIARAGVPVHTSDTIMRLDALPERLVILGGGYIAAEFAHVFSALGVRVCLAARSRPLLRHLDDTLAERFTATVASRWELHLGRLVRQLEGDSSGIRATLDDGTVLTGDVLLVATGRIPNSDLLDLDAAGVTTHVDGRIVIDPQQRTRAEGVYALGDISSEYQLKHVANHEARVVAHNLLHPDEPVATDHRFVPAAVFTDPQIATVGLTETDCVTRGLDFAVQVQEYGDVAYGWAMEDTTGFCKVIAERGSGRLLGAHLMGPQASSLIQPLVQAMSLGQTAREIASGQYWIHPALPEVLENALLGLEL
jgi:mycothione reductase